MRTKINLPHLRIKIFKQDLYYLQSSIRDYLPAIGKIRHIIPSDYFISKEQLYTLVLVFRGNVHLLIELPPVAKILELLQIVTIFSPNKIRLIISLPSISQSPAQKIFQYILTPNDILNSDTKYYLNPSDLHLAVTENKENDALYNKNEMSRCKFVCKSLKNSPTPRFIYN